MGQGGDFMAKSISVKTGDLRSIPGTHRVEGETAGIPLQAYIHRSNMTNTHTYTLKVNINY